jgi:hypothetical protein
MMESISSAAVGDILQFTFIDMKPKMLKHGKHGNVTLAESGELLKM